MIQRYLCAENWQWLDYPEPTAPVIVSALFDENGHRIEGSEMVMQPMEVRNAEDHQV